MSTDHPTRSGAQEDLERRIAELAGSDGHRNYLEVRSHVLRMKDLAREAEAETDAPSSYWSEELENFDYLLDASPFVTAKLRQHSYHLTGIWSYNYRTHKSRPQRQHAEKLEALVQRAGGDRLLVPESPVLGGFGFDLGGRLVNIDTLKYFEVLVAMDEGGVLGDFDGSAERRYAWEIGAGWGGFPYQFKTLFPNTTYVITDFPELFLYSATYLMTAFPDARCSFYGDGEVDWSADFVFLPHTDIAAVAPPRLDLALNMVSFQEMTTGQVEAYVRRAWELESPYLYSLNRERSLYNPELRGVRAILQERFWPQEVQVLPVSYVKMLDAAPRKASGKPKKKTPKASAKGEDLDYKHLVGVRKILP